MGVERDVNLLAEKKKTKTTDRGERGWAGEAKSCKTAGDWTVD